MESQQHLDYERVAKAIRYIQTHFKERPSLDTIAETVHLSPYHFQRMFTDWAGVSSKKFMQYLSLDYAKGLLKAQASLFDTAYETGLSGTGRLHDLFVNIEGMTPAEYKKGGAELRISYSYAQSPFGKILVAATAKGICHMAVASDDTEAFSELKTTFPNAVYVQEVDVHQQQALFAFQHNRAKIGDIKLHLKGSPFQLKVWEALLRIPEGQRATYGALAYAIGQPTASRAVGTAIGSNPVAYLIPCHRVIKATGAFGGYRWGTDRKVALLGWESARNNT